METVRVFPEGVFPAIVEQYINELNTKQKLPRDYLAATFLSVAAVCCGLKYEAQISSTHKQFPILWIALEGDSGARKSPSLKLMIEPLKAIDRKLQQQYMQELNEYSKKNSQLNEPAPKQRQVLLDDSTMEGVIEAVVNNQHALLLFKDEIMSLIADGNRYNSTGSIERWLSLYDKTGIKVNRKNSSLNRDVEDPVINIIGGIQPKILPQLLTEQLMNNGFIMRVLFVKSRHHIRVLAEGEVHPHVIEDYRYLVKKMWEYKPIVQPALSSVAKGLMLTETANYRYCEWLTNVIFPIINEKENTDVLRAYASKLEATVIRIALILEYTWQVAGNAEPIHIGEESLERAIRITEYFLNCWIEILADLTRPNKQGIIIQTLVNNVKKDQNLQRSAIHDLAKSGIGNNETAKIMGLAKSTISTIRNQSE